MLSRDQSPEVGRETSLDESKEDVRPQSDRRKKKNGRGEESGMNVERKKGRADEGPREGRLVEIGDSARNSD